MSIVFVKPEFNSSQCCRLCLNEFKNEITFELNFEIQDAFLNLTNMKVKHKRTFL